MKTTKLINGKTFDEVFAERGEETTIDKMVVGNIYFFDIEDYDNVLIIFAGLNNLKRYPQSEIGTVHDLWSDGDILHIDREDGRGGYIREQITAVYEATPNQIALHTMYINHNN